MRSRDDLVGAVVFSNLAGVATHQAFTGTPGAWVGAVLLAIIGGISARRVWLALGRVS